MTQSGPRASHILSARGVFLDPPGEVIAGVGILVQNEQITATGSLDDLRADAPPGTPIVDLGDRVLVPGLMNTHVHLSFSAGSDPRADYYADPPETRLARALANAHTMLESGVTTVRDCGSDWAILALHDIARKGLALLPNLLLCGPPITITGGHLHQMGGEADGEEDLRKLTRLLHKRGANSIKVMATGGQMTPGTIPERPAFTLDELRAIVQTATELGHPTVAHVLASEGVRRAAQAGFDSLEHCAYFERAANGLLERCYDEEIATEVARSGASAMIGVTAGYHTLDGARSGGPATDAQGFWLEQEERMFQIIRRFVEHGIPIVCGTDAGVRDTPFDETWRELALLVERAGFSPLEAVRTATVNAARALHLTGRAGQIAVGQRADLIAVEGDPLSGPDVFRTVPWVMRRGQVVKGEGSAQ